MSGRKSTRALATMGMVLVVLAVMAVSLYGQASAPPPQKVVLDAPPEDGLRRDWFERYALNVLLVPLLDDSQPPRWSDLGLEMYCGPGTRVFVDGRPMVSGQEIPPGAFTLRWEMDSCIGLAEGRQELSGAVELMVFREENGVSALVTPQRLGPQPMQVSGPGWPPFVAYASFGV